jgi:hypothetical protein
METFLIVLRALLDADIQVQSAHFNAVALLGGHQIEVVVDDSAEAERVVEEATKLGLHSVVPPTIAAPDTAITVAIDTPRPA